MGVTVQISLDGKQYNTGIKDGVKVAEMEDIIHEAMQSKRVLSINVAGNSRLLLSPGALQRAAFFIEEWGWL